MLAQAFLHFLSVQQSLRSKACGWLATWISGRARAGCWASTWTRASAPTRTSCRPSRRRPRRRAPARRSQRCTCTFTVLSHSKTCAGHGAQRCLYNDTSVRLGKGLCKRAGAGRGRGCAARARGRGRSAPAQRRAGAAAAHARAHARLVHPGLGRAGRHGNARGAQRRQRRARRHPARAPVGRPARPHCSPFLSDCINQGVHSAFVECHTAGKQAELRKELVTQHYKTRLPASIHLSTSEK